MDKNNLLINLGGDNNFNISDKIYTIRGQKVMLDFDLAKIYGYETKNFNKQVKNNFAKFEGEDFMFRLTRKELEENLRFKFFTSSWGGVRYLPYAFTESEIYMLMTVLRGELATKQSRALIGLFRDMKNYYLETQNYSLISQVVENKHNIEKIETELEKTLKKSDISPILLNFNTNIQNEFIFFNGELAKATETFIDLYSVAKKSIYIIDNYINIKTLRQLRKVKEGAKIIIFSDNKANTLRKSDYEDFKKEYPNTKIDFVKTNNIIHDRFIIIDNNKYYHLGTSIKDTGGKVCMVNLLESEVAKHSLDEIVERMMGNEKLKLK